MTLACFSHKRHYWISTHMPLARHDSTRPRYIAQPSISTHMPLARHDCSMFRLLPWTCHFYSHASCEAWRGWHISVSIMPKFLLTCLLRGMTLCVSDITERAYISTHMPLARHDLSASLSASLSSNFYSHASCEAWHYSRMYSALITDFYSHASCEAWL